jgi:transposase
MPQAISFDKRAEIWQRKSQGQANAEIARAVEVSPQTVKRILNRGPAGIAPGYDRCGRNGREHSAEVQKAAIDLKREHPGWGGVVIGLKLAKTFARVPASRTLQRWFLKAELNPKRERKPKIRPDKGTQPHDVWELDAKEQVLLLETKRRCAMLAVDEASGALIGAVAFPPRKYWRASDRGCARRAAQSLREIRLTKGTAC